MFNLSIENVPGLVVKNNNKNEAGLDESEKKPSFYANAIRAFQENPLAIYLSEFTFDEPIRLITHKNEITFTLYGYCIDDQCPQPSMTHNFDEPSEITNGPSPPNVKRFDPSDIGSTVGSTIGSTVGSTVSTVENAGNTAVNETKQIVDDASNLLSSFLNGLANFKPEPLYPASEVNTRDQEFIWLVGVPYS
ncbi:16426_t:CDS:2 [Acaulospora colombiana]|uniref:16426_t:CDS:1 n=1 Tax=Acaulospora colombiana TaxID=27376 RepID=A0ACA9KTJ6_9GLOM|nr:16426_t:CDS:2 [Acaulospora colombiana]